MGDLDIVYFKLFQYRRKICCSQVCPDHEWDGQPAWLLICLEYIIYWHFLLLTVVLTSKRIAATKETEDDWDWEVCV